MGAGSGRRAASKTVLDRPDRPWPGDSLPQLFWNTSRAGAASTSNAPAAIAPQRRSAAGWTLAAAAAALLHGASSPTALEDRRQAPRHPFERRPGASRAGAWTGGSPAGKPWQRCWCCWYRGPGPCLRLHRAGPFLGSLITRGAAAESLRARLSLRPCCRAERQREVARHRFQKNRRNSPGRNAPAQCRCAPGSNYAGLRASVIVRPSRPAPPRCTRAGVAPLLYGATVPPRALHCGARRAKPVKRCRPAAKSGPT